MMTKLITRTGAFLLCLAMTGIGTARGQDNDEGWQESDVAEWLEPFEEEGETHFGTADPPADIKADLPRGPWIPRSSRNPRRQAAPTMLR